LLLLLVVVAGACDATTAGRSARQAADADGLSLEASGGCVAKEPGDDADSDNDDDDSGDSCAGGCCIIEGASSPSLLLLLDWSSSSGPRGMIGDTCNTTCMGSKDGL